LARYFIVTRAFDYYYEREHMLVDDIELDARFFTIFED